MIEVFDPIIGEEEIEAVVAALRRGEISGSFGESIPRFEQEFAEYCGCKHGIAVSSGSTALHLAVAAADLGAGDEVLISASTNIATALAVIHNNAIPVPVDSENHYLEPRPRSPRRFNHRKNESHHPRASLRSSR